MADDKILDRVRKLLELASNNANASEAANAAAAAQALMSRHAIDQAMLDVDQDDDERSEPIERDVLHRHDASTLPTWKGSLAVGMCEVNGCKCYRNGNVLGIIGRPSDAATVRYLFTYVASEIDRLCGIESKLRGTPGRTWCNNFRLGAVSEVTRRMKEAHASARKTARLEAQASDTMGTGSAIVLVNNAIARVDQRKADVDAWLQANMKLGKARSGKHRVDYGAREAGRRAGASIDLSRALRG